MSATLFSVALEYPTCEIDKFGSIRSKSPQIIACADNIVIIARNRKKMEQIHIYGNRNGEEANR